MRALLWHNRLLVALCVNAALLLWVVLLFNNHPADSIGSAAFAAAPPVASAAPGPAATAIPSKSDTLIIMPGQLAPNIYGCYLLDPARQSLCVYEYFHSDGLKLVAARNIAYDRRLQDFNTSPAPSEVKALAQSSPPPPSDTDH